MAKYIPSPRDWVREQVDLYESSGGSRGTTLRDTGLPVVIVTHRGNKTGEIRKTPLMRVKDGNNYVLVGSQGGAPNDPAWVHNLRADPHIELRDASAVAPMRVREIKDAAERARLWTLASRGVSAVCGLPDAHKTSNSGLCRRALSPAGWARPPTPPPKSLIRMFGPRGNPGGQDPVQCDRPFAEARRCAASRERIVGTQLV
jgi:deazaflavin-dependent oxidoreductase (nitroreductase family)